MLLCPSAWSPENTVTAIMALNYGPDDGTNYPLHASHGTTGAHIISTPPGRLVLGRTNYVGCGGEFRANAPYDIYKGLLMYKSRNSLSRVPDGTSNTMLFCEAAGGPLTGIGGGIPDGVLGWAWGCGFGYTSFGVDWHHPPGLGQNDQWGLFSSNHTNHIVNVCFADGSVRNIKKTTAFTVLLALGGFADGVVITFDN
jgi:prepilin-type processing-associated H-X9-DG protein